jgi:hypothetical protein
MNKYNRLFAFGCSFTSYNWPTWPDIIKYDLQIPTENWGLCGQGNVGMMHRMLEADIKNSFNENDLIITVWSTWHREDRYLGSWTLSGNIFNDKQLYDKRFKKKFWNLENDIVKNAGSIIAANKMFNINYQCSIVELDNDIYSHNNLYKFYEPHLPKKIFPWNHNDQTIYKAFEGKLAIDNHPDIEGHLLFVKDHVYPELGLTMQQKTIDHFTELQKTVIANLKKANINTWNDHDAFFKSMGWHKRHIGF